VADNGKLICGPLQRVTHLAEGWMSMDVVNRSSTMRGETREWKVSSSRGDEEETEYLEIALQ
jgi:hypothetical protein